MVIWVDMDNPEDVRKMEERDKERKKIRRLKTEWWICFYFVIIALIAMGIFIYLEVEKRADYKEGVILGCFIIAGIFGWRGYVIANKDELSYTKISSFVYTLAILFSCLFFLALFALWIFSGYEEFFVKEHKWWWTLIFIFLSLCWVPAVWLGIKAIINR